MGNRIATIRFKHLTIPTTKPRAFMKRLDALLTEFEARKGESSYNYNEES